MRTSVLFNLDFTKILYYHASFSFSQLLSYTFFIRAAIAQFFKPISKLIIPIGIPSKEGKTETGIHPVIVETKIKKSIQCNKL